MCLAEVKAAHEKAIRQGEVESKALPPPSSVDAADRLEELFLRVAGQWPNDAVVEIREPEDGRQAIMIVRPEDRQIAATLAAKALPKPGVLE